MFKESFSKTSIFFSILILFSLPHFLWSPISNPESFDFRAEAIAQKEVIYEEYPFEEVWATTRTVLKDLGFSEEKYNLEENKGVIIARLNRYLWHASALGSKAGNIAAPGQPLQHDSYYLVVSMKKKEPKVAVNYFVGVKQPGVSGKIGLRILNKVIKAAGEKLKETHK